MIKNITKGTVISDDYKICSSILCKARGLMFRKNPAALVFEFNREQRNSLHMMFVFFLIDVIFLDKDKKVVEIKENFRPFAMYIPKNKSMYVIELEKGKIAESRSEIGDIIAF